MTKIQVDYTKVSSNYGKKSKHMCKQVSFNAADP